MTMENVKRVAKLMEYYIHVNVLASELAKKCNIEVFLQNESDLDFSITFNSLGTGVIPDKVLEHIIENSFDFNVVSILHYLNLIKPKNPEVTDDSRPWEEPDKAIILIHKVLSLFTTREEWFKSLAAETVDEVPEYIFLNYVMERPGHPGQFGFLFHSEIITEHKDGHEVFTKLIIRAGKIPKDILKKSTKENRERMRLMRGLSKD